jgi:hypothetical protein
MSAWFRLAGGTAMDARWPAIALKLRCDPAFVVTVVVALADHAARQQQLGNIGDFDIERLAAFLGGRDDQIRAILEQLEARGIIRGGMFQPGEIWRTDGTSTERSRRWRKNHPAGNAAVTLRRDGGAANGLGSVGSPAERVTRPTTVTAAGAPVRALPADPGPATLEARLLQAGNNNVRPTAHDTVGIIEDLIADEGCDLEVDILPVVRELVNHPDQGPIKSWGIPWLLEAIRERRDARRDTGSGMSLGTPSASVRPLVHRGAGSTRPCCGRMHIELGPDTHDRPVRPDRQR